MGELQFERYAEGITLQAFLLFQTLKCKKPLTFRLTAFLYVAVR